MPRYRVAQWIQPGHDLHGQPVDIHHSTGQPLDIKRCAGELNSAEGDRDLGNTVAFPGWVDLQCDFRDPGTDRAEGLLHGLKVASSGGFCGGPRGIDPPLPGPTGGGPACVDGHQRPHGDGCPACRCRQRRAERHPTHRSPSFGVRRSNLAFSDDAPIDRPELLRRALEYHQKLGTRIFFLKPPTPPSNQKA